MDDATGVAEAMLGLPGFRVLGVEETAAELIIEIETTDDLVGCPECGVVATAHDRIGGRVSRSGRLRSAGAASLAKAALALRGASLPRSDLDRDLAGVLAAVPADQPGRP